MKTNTNCHLCKKEIYKRPSHLKRHKVHFCDINCKQQYESLQTKKIKIKCSHCNNEIERTNAELRKSYNKTYFCNNTCKNRYLNSVRWKDNPNPTSHKHKRNNIFKKCNTKCVVCGYSDDERMLDIHHIDKNHQNNIETNLVSVCVWCHNLHHRCDKELNVLI